MGKKHRDPVSTHLEPTVLLDALVLLAGDLVVKIGKKKIIFFMELILVTSDFPQNVEDSGWW